MFLTLLRNSCTLIITFGCLFISTQLIAQSVKGTVIDEQGKPLAYASVYLKDGKGTTSNTDGVYQLDLVPGKYTITCAHIGYTKHERTVTVEAGKIATVDFTLFPTQVELNEVVVKAGAEDPAYEIMRNAIKKRKQHLNEATEGQCTVYMKGLIRTLKVPKSVMGQKVDLNKDIFDSTGKGIIYFSESLTRYSKRKDGMFKEEVISAKVSGNKSGFGFNSPSDLEVNLYENNIMLQGMNSRGFVSPLQDNAFHYYRYKYLGSFYEDGMEVNKIAVFPKRKYEPLFAGGYINIIEGSWRIYSFHLNLNKESQIEFVDSLELVQEMFEAEKNRWVPKYTRILATFGALGFRAAADFASVYSDYDLKPLPSSFWKGNIIKTIDTSANKKTAAYWETLRPIPLTLEEEKDYVKKDSLEQKFNDPKYLDSLDKRANRIQPIGLILDEQTFFSRARKTRTSIPGILKSVQYNTVEQWAFCIEPTFRKWSDTGAYTIAPRVRYNTGLNRFYADLTFSKRIGMDYRKRWDLTAAGGRYIYQINSDNPIDPITNTFATLLYTSNFMKIYEKSYGRLAARKVLGNGFTLTLRTSFEERRPLENTDTSYVWRRYKDRNFTSNYPEELPEGKFNLHQAFLTGLTLRFQPGIKYIQYPTRIVSTGSDAPVFTLNLTKAWADVFGSDEQFGKWRLTMTDDFNMKLGGTVKYNLGAGGFIQNRNVELPDFQHFLGNQTIVASPFGRSFQLAPYYANSTSDGLYANGHIEWHLNGLITNKIPLLRKANMGIVTGSNAFYVDQNRNYSEIFVGLENILKVFRVDYVWGYDGFAKNWVHGIVIGFGGVFSGDNGE